MKVITVVLLPILLVIAWISIAPLLNDGGDKTSSEKNPSAAAFEKPTKSKSTHRFVQNPGRRFEQGLALESYDTLEFLKDQVLKDENPLVRQIAVRKLALLGGNGALSAITNALGDIDSDVRGSAIRALAEAPGENLPLFGRVLFGDPDPGLRLLAIEAIASRQSPAALALMKSALLDEDERVRFQARSWLEDTDWIAAQGHKGDETLGSTEQPTSDERLNTISEIHQYEQSEAIAYLKEALVRDQDPAVREEALFALADMGEEAANAAVPSALRDVDAQVRGRAIQVLAETTDDNLPLFGQVLFGDPDPDLRLQAIEAIASRESPAALALMEAALLDEDQRVSSQARFWLEDTVWTSRREPNSDESQGSAEQPTLQERINTIGEIHQHEESLAISSLKEALTRDQNPAVREEALLALAYIGGEAAYDVIPSALGDAEYHIRELAIQLIGEAGSTHLYLLGQVLFGEQDPELRRQAVEIIAQQPNPAALAFLKAATQDQNKNVRKEAQRALNRGQ